MFSLFDRAESWNQHDFCLIVLAIFFMITVVIDMTLACEQVLYYAQISARLIGLPRKVNTTTT